jgi:hypothetical protein
MNSEISAVFQNTLSMNKADRERGKHNLFLISLSNS